MKGQHGTALSEFVIIMVFFTPVLIGMPLIAKYSDIKSKTIEASRYAAWERTVWSDASAKRNDGDKEIVKSKNTIRQEIDQRFFGNPVQGLHDTTASINHMWRNRKGDMMLKGDRTSNPQNTPRRAALALTHEVATKKMPIAARANALPVDAIAFAFDKDDHGSVTSAGGSGIFDTLANSELGTFVSRNIQCNPVGINLTDGIDLGAKGFASAEVTILANDFMHGDEPVRYAFKAKSAVLGNAWAAPDEDIFSKRVDNIALGDMAGCITLIGDAIGTVTSFGFGGFMFGEGMKANPVEDFNSRGSSNSRVLPPYLEKR